MTRTRTHPKGIRPIPSGWQAYVRVRGQLYTHAFPPGTALDVMRAWRDHRKWVILSQHPRPTKGTFAADVAQYLTTVTTMPTHAERAKHLAEWVDAFGARPRYLIQPADIRAFLESARGRGLAASSVNKRRTALTHLYTVLDGKSAPNPVREVPRYREPEVQPRGLPLAQVKKILQKLPASKAKARLSVMAWTGLPASSLMRLRPEDVNWHKRVVWIAGRHKGRGTAGRWLPLVDRAVTALRQLDRWDAWGPFSNTPVRRAFRTAAKKAGLPPTVRPYDLRHSWLTFVGQTSGDERAVQALAGHADIRTTRRYTEGSVPIRVAEAMSAIRRKLERKRGRKR